MVRMAAESCLLAMSNAADNSSGKTEVKIIISYLDALEETADAVASWRKDFCSKFIAAEVVGSALEFP